MAEMAKIRVIVDTLDIEVNDNGDILSVPVGDERFLPRLQTYLTDISKLANTFDEKMKNDGFDPIVESVNFHTAIKDGFIELFGDTSYDMVFGKDVVVSADYVIDFLDQLRPLLEKYQKKRSKKLTKYNATRVGSSL